MPRFIEYILYSLQTFTVSATGVAQPNSSRGFPPEIELYVTVGSAPTGTTPTLAFNLMASVDGTNFANIGVTTPNITAAGTYRFLFQNVFAPTIRLDPVLGGTTPSFTNVTVYMLTSGSEEN